MSKAKASGAVMFVAAAAVQRTMEKHGGVWVGGRITATPQRLWFTANAMNRAVHAQLEDISIAAADIQSITRVFGWVTGIVVVQHRQGESRFRCFGAKQFAATLAERYSKPSVSGTC